MISPFSSFSALLGSPAQVFTNIANTASAVRTPMKTNTKLIIYVAFYDYDDMVALQHELLDKGLGINHLRLMLGTSMGCMHSWVWAETYPDFMDALMPLACLPVQIAGRNRIWRKMVIDGIRQDPDWKNGEYRTEPRAGLQIAADLLLIIGGGPIEMQKKLPYARRRRQASRGVHETNHGELGRE
jgi:homoserine O-acetyltransferase/O-succinyltransferase